MADQKRILIGEDEKPIAKALELKLKHSGYSVDVGHNGEDILDFLSKNKYDLLLLDIVMPKLDGFGTLAKMKEGGNKTHTIILSNLSQEMDAEKAKELGADGYFIKSDTPLSEIVKKIEEILN